jgi:hypothetical protein
MAYPDEAPSGKIGKGPHWFGVELEVEVGSDYNVDDKAQECLDLFRSEFICAKEDGSLDNGFELVTAPATLEEQIKGWDRFFKAIPSGLKSFNTTTCGLHVHCSRRPLTELQIAKIVCFVNAAQNRAFVETIAGRGSNSYCTIKVKKIGNANKDCYSRYEAVNLQNSCTIEFRIFKGTLKRESVFKAIEFCAALIAFTGTGVQSVQESMDRDRFIQFVKQGRKSWPHLDAFIKAAWFGITTEEITEMGFKIQRRVMAVNDSGGEQ